MLHWRGHKTFGSMDSSNSHLKGRTYILRLRVLNCSFRSIQVLKLQDFSHHLKGNISKYFSSWNRYENDRGWGNIFETESCNIRKQEISVLFQERKIVSSPELFIFTMFAVCTLSCSNCLHFNSIPNSTFIYFCYSWNGIQNENCRENVEMILSPGGSHRLLPLSFLVTFRSILSWNLIHFLPRNCWLQAFPLTFSVSNLINVLSFLFFHHHSLPSSANDGIYWRRNKTNDFKRQGNVNLMPTFIARSKVIALSYLLCFILSSLPLPGYAFNPKKMSQTRRRWRMRWRNSIHEVWMRQGHMFSHVDVSGESMERFHQAKISPWIEG